MGGVHIAHSVAIQRPAFPVDISAGELDAGAGRPIVNGALNIQRIG